MCPVNASEQTKEKRKPFTLFKPIQNFLLHFTMSDKMYCNFHIRGTVVLLVYYFALL